MNKEKLGYDLSKLRNGRPVNGLTKYSIKSIETGRSSYPVTNLLKYCKELSLRLVLTDKATGESYPADEIQEVHEILQMLMKRWQFDEASMYRKAEVHYTPPKGDNGSLSISTMLAMCSVLRCKLSFIQTN